ncbi:MAG: Gfo/Idh/MocA family oxidoreductase [bacterium]
MAKMKFAILSFAHLHGFSYAAALGESAQVEFAAFSEENRALREKMRKRYPKVQAFKDHQTLLREANVDAVIVTSPNAQHKQMTLDAARAGKSVLCEKPLATTMADCREMIEACRKAGVVLMTAFPVRFSPAVEAAVRRIEAGDLGKIFAVKATNHGSMPGGWFVDRKRSGGGCIMDHTVHVIDLLRSLLKKEVVEVVSESATRLHPIKVEDCGTLLFEMEGGIIGSLDTSWSRGKGHPIEGDVTLEFKGEKANLSVDCFPQEMMVYDHVNLKPQALSLPDPLDLFMIEEFADAVRSGRQPRITGEDGMRAVEVALGAYEAIKKRRPQRLGA